MDRRSVSDGSHAETYFYKIKKKPPRCPAIVEVALVFVGMVA
jgi:hypothetical protein